MNPNYPAIDPVRDFAPWVDEGASRVIIGVWVRQGGPRSGAERREGQGVGKGKQAASEDDGSQAVEDDGTGFELLLEREIDLRDLQRVGPNVRALSC